MFLLGFWVFFPLFLFCFVGLFVCFLGYSIHFCTGKLLGCALTVRLLFDLRFYCPNRCIYLLLILKGRLGDDLCLSTVTFVVRLISVPLVTSYFAIVSVYVYLLYSIIHGLESFSPPPITVFSFFSLSVIFIPLGISSWVDHYPWSRRYLVFTVLFFAHILWYFTSLFVYCAAPPPPPHCSSNWDVLFHSSKFSNMSILSYNIVNSEFRDSTKKVNVLISWF